MNIPKHPHTIIRQARRKLGRTQLSVAQATGICRTRLSDLERGRFVPTPEEQRRLAACLEIPKSVLRAAVPIVTKDAFAKVRHRFQRTPRTFYPPRDRESGIRFATARRRAPKLVSSLCSRISTRRDFDQRLARLYLRDAAFDSYLEILVSLHLLADDAQPGLASPSHSDFCDHQVVDPRSRKLVGHRRCPVLYVPGADCLLFPQVSILVGGSCFTLDLLAGVFRPQCTRWHDLEVDGDGHDPQGDFRRTQALGIPIHRWTTDDVLDGGFTARLKERLKR